MTDLDLARRAVACKHWRWTLGMQLEDGRRVVGWTEDGRELLYCTNGMVGCFGLLSESECTPDLTDPATVGCLLALVREAWGDPTMHAAYRRSPDMDGKHWYMRRPDVSFHRHHTEAAALVAALEVAP